MIQRLVTLVCGAVVASFAATAFAQPADAQTQSANPGQTTSATAPTQVQPAQPTWESFPTMILEKIYRGPLKDTVIQRWRDPIDGSVCYIYLPISVPFVPNPAAYAQYGASGVGNISCVHTTEVVQLMQPTPSQPAAPPQRR
jgi:hypothetical protein